MFGVRIGLVSILAACAAVVDGQATWAKNQVSTTMCYWEQPRAALIRDTVYLDGGEIWWLPGMADGSSGSVISDENPLGIVYALNFSVPFNTTQNITALLQQLPKVAGGSSANNIAPNYLDGAMLANDGEWFTYGGMLRNTAAYVPPYGDEVLSYQAYQYGVEKDGFLPGYVDDRLPEGMTRYLAYGGAASAPSENKGWYFSGMHSPLFGEIYQPGTGNVSFSAVNVSDTFITLDMATQQQETWSNATLPELIRGRANPELVWVPVGGQGILVALGGVVFPEFISDTRTSSNEAQSKVDSPKFMSTIDIYDVAGSTWYQQPTTGGPGALTRGCAVVAPAQDASSFNIYYWGGYDGLDASEEFNDDVWVLSLPSFKWTKVAEGNADHGRAGHRCFMPYPDQMMAIGGYAAMSGSAPTCVDGGIIQLFNVSSGTWMTEYDPTKYSNYTVPDAVVKNIGGSPTGGATATKPASTGWATAGLGKVFETAYPMTRITKYYPYTPAETKNNTNPVVSEVPQSGGSGTPAYLPPLLGTIFGLMFITLVVTGIFLWRRRRMLRRNGPSEFGTDDSNGHRIMSWIRGQPALDQKAPTVTTEDTAFSPSVETPPVLYHPAYPPMTQVMHHEVADTQIAELMDTSPRAELSDTGLSPVDIISRHSRLGSLNDQSTYSSMTQTDYASTMSLSSAAAASAAAAATAAATVAASTPLVSPTSNRADSPPLGRAYYDMAAAAVSPPEQPGVTTQDPMDAQAGRVASDVSAVSERERAHLRQISDASVSSVGEAGYGVERGLSPVDERDGTTPAVGGSDDSRSALARKSVFRENPDDMGSH